MDNLESLKIELAQNQQALQMMSQINQIKTGLIGQTAHELRSPLSSLMSLMQLILNDLCENPEEEREFIAQAYTAAGKLLGMIDELVLVSKLDAGAIAFNLKPIELSTLLDKLFHLTHLQAANRNIRLVIPNSSNKTHFLADESRLLPVLVMLVDLMIHQQEGGSIAIGAETQSNQKSIVISFKVPFSKKWWQDDSVIPPLPEPLTIEKLQSWSRNLHLSFGMQWQLVRIIIEGMGGRSTSEEIEDKFNKIVLFYLEFPSIHPLNFINLDSNPQQ